MLDRKGILTFLLLTFIPTYAIEFGLVAAGMRFDSMDNLTAAYAGQIAVAALMWSPALAAFITVKYITREGFENVGLRIGEIKPYLILMAAMPLLFVVIYGLTWLLGFGSPDWDMQSFLALLEKSGANATPPLPPPALYGVLFAISVVMSPWINSVFALGEEIGWRGYLLPKLMPLGKPSAYAVMGIIWGLWHLPLVLVGYTYPGVNTALAVVLFLTTTTVIGITLNELRLRYHSSVLAGWGHGLLNSQRFGIWAILFAQTNPALGGWAGVIGIVVWTGVGIAVFQAKRSSEA